MSTNHSDQLPENFGKATPPRWQRPLNPVKGSDTQDVWIVGAFDDDEYCLGVYKNPNFCEDGLIDSLGWRSYDNLWLDLATLDWGSAKAWLIGFRTRFALDRAGFVESLDAGAVKLPTIKDGKRKGKHGGKLTMNRRVVEVDVECGRNKIKILDWENFGVRPDAHGIDVADQTIADGARVLRGFLESMNDIGVDVNKTTGAQIGWQHFRLTYQPDALMVNLDDDCRALERRAYHAGRNECYRLGDIPGTTYSLDVRSCYAHICATELLPAWLIEEYRHGCDVDEVKDWNDCQWIADVEIQTDQPDYPLSLHGVPIYPVGRFITSLCWPELRHAICHNRVVKVLRAARYASRPVFRSYAEWYMRVRVGNNMTGHKHFEPALKSLFNASLGYTARQKYQWAEWNTQIGHRYFIGVTSSPENHTESVAVQKLDDEARWLRIDGEPREAMPMLHATIASYARVKLLSIYEAAGRENILYVDTDGILCNIHGINNLVLHNNMAGPNPGQLCQRFAPGSCRIQGQKAYQIGDNVIQAGVVKSRYSKLTRKQTLATETGRADATGRVVPFEFRVVDGKNEMV